MAGPEVVAGAAKAPSASSRSKMTQDAIAGLIARRKEVPSSYGALKELVNAVYNIDVGVSTIGSYCRKADAADKLKKNQ